MAFYPIPCIMALYPMPIKPYIMAPYPKSQTPKPPKLRREGSSKK